MNASNWHCLSMSACFHDELYRGQPVLDVSSAVDAESGAQRTCSTDDDDDDDDGSHTVLLERES